MSTRFFECVGFVAWVWVCFFFKIISTLGSDRFASKGLRNPEELRHLTDSLTTGRELQPYTLTHEMVDQMPAKHNFED